MQMKLKVLLALPLILGLVQCDSKPKGPSPYSFAAILELTPAAEAKLKGTKQEIGVTAFYFGQATPAYAAEADVAHRIRLGYEVNFYSVDARKVRLAADDIDESLFPKIVDKDPQVLLTAYSTAVQGNPNGAIECRSVVVAIKRAQVAPPVIKCDVGGAV